MNKTFKTLWNKTRGCFVVCNEVTKSHGKPKTAKIAITLSLAALTSCLAIPPLQAKETALNEMLNQTVENKSENLTLGAGDEAFGGIFHRIVDKTFLSEGSSYLNNTFEVTPADKAANWPAGAVFYISALDTRPSATFTNDRFSGNKIILNSSTVNDAVAYGGAIGIKGSEITFTNVAFNDNQAISKADQTGGVAVGGAVFIDKKIGKNSQNQTFNSDATVRFVATKNLTYSGNNVVSATPDKFITVYGGYIKTSGGFLAMDRASTAEFDVQGTDTVLTLGLADANYTDNPNLDSIASSIYQKKGDYDGQQNVINKLGNGSFIVNSTLNDYYGLVNVKAGTMQVNSDWKIRNTVTVDGGRLVLNTFSMSSLKEGYDKTTSDEVGSLVIGGENTGELVVKGNTFDLSATTLNAKGTLTLIGQTVTSDSNNSSALVQVKNSEGGTIQLENVSISNQKTDDRGAVLLLEKGSLSVVGGSYSSNEAKTRGGALEVNNQDWSKTNSETVKIKDALFTENKVTGASDKLGGAIFVRGADVNISNTTFSNNQVISDKGYAEGGGALYVQGWGLNKTLIQVGGAYNNNTVVATGTRDSITQNVGGGAIVLKGVDATFTDVDFSGNVVDYSGVTGTSTAAAQGGAIAVDKSTSSVDSNGKKGFTGSVRIAITQDKTYVGNSVKSAPNQETSVFENFGYVGTTSGGFLILERGSEATFDIKNSATLTLGTAGSGDSDSIASDIPTLIDTEDSEKGTINNKSKFSTLTKTGSGTLLINSTLNKYYGTIAVDEGTLKVTSDWALGNNLTVNAGLLEVENLNLLSLKEAFNGQTNNTGADRIASDAQGNLDIKAGATVAINGNLTGSSGTSITSAGSLTIKGTVSGYKGNYSQTGGSVALDNTTGMFGGDVKVSGGSFSVVGITDTLDLSKVSLSDSGSLLATSGQITGSIETNLAEAGYSGLTSLESGVTKAQWTGGELHLSVGDAQGTGAFTTAYSKALTALLANEQGSSATLFMHGTLVDESGAAKTEASIGELAGAGVQTNVTATVDEGTTSVKIGASDSSTGVESVTSSLGVKQLDLTKATGDNKSIEVAGDKSLTLYGDGSGDLVATNDGDSLAIKVGGSGSDNAGSLILGNANDENAGGSLAVKSLEIGNSSSAVAHQTALTAETVSLGGQAAATIGTNSSVQTEKLSLGEGATLAVSGNAQVVADQLIGDAGAVISVGDALSAGKLIAKEVNLKGATLFLDPVFAPSQGINGTSQAALTFANNTIDGNVVVGQNSLATLGDSSMDKALASFGETGLSWAKEGDVTAAAYLASSQTLGSGHSFVVDGSHETLPSTLEGNSATFANQSLLMLAKGATLSAAESSKLTVGETAKLLLLDVKADNDITVASGFSVAGSNAWKTENILTNNRLVVAKDTDFTNGEFTVSLDKASASVVLPGVLIPNILDSLVTNGSDASTSSTFLNSVLNPLVVGDTAQAVAILNGAAQLAVTGAVHSVAMDTLGMTTSSINSRLSLANPEAPQGSAIWVDLVGQINQAKKLFGSHGYKSDLAGAVLGADHTMDNGLTLGGAVTIGTGSARSRGSAPGTKNDVDYLGVNLYGAQQLGAFNLIGDIAYQHTSNDVSMSPLGTKISSKIKTNALSLGVTAESRIELTPAVDVIPHAGLRYTYLKTDGYSNQVFDVESDKQNIFQVPVGVTLTGKITPECGWVTKPMVDLSIVPSFGDKKAKTTVRQLAGTVSDSFETRVIDTSLVQARLGMTATKGAHSLGVHYGLGVAGHDRFNQNLKATYRYTF